jgi:hypothetical protein
LVAGGWWLVAGGWWLVAGGWWLVAGGWRRWPGGLVADGLVASGSLLSLAVGWLVGVVSRSVELASGEHVDGLMDSGSACDLRVSARSTMQRAVHMPGRHCPQPCALHESFREFSIPVSEKREN